MLSILMLGVINLNVVNYVNLWSEEGEGRFLLNRFRDALYIALQPYKLDSECMPKLNELFRIFIII